MKRKAVEQAPSSGETLPEGCAPPGIGFAAEQDPGRLGRKGAFAIGEAVAVDPSLKKATIGAQRGAEVSN